LNLNRIIIFFFLSSLRLESNIEGIHAGKYIKPVFPTDVLRDMPHFIDLFSSQIDRNWMIKELLGNKWIGPEWLKERFASQIGKNWVKMDRGFSTNTKVLAVDGSEAIRTYSNRAMLYIVRALGLCGPERFRNLESDCFQTRSSQEAKRYVNTRRERLELEVARKAIEALDLKEGSAVLLDGSLYGKAVHLPKDSPISGGAALVLQFLESYWRLLEACRERKLLLLGMSKDSNTSFLRDYLLGEILQEELKEIGGVSADKLMAISSFFNKDVLGRQFSSESEAVEKWKRRFGDLSPRMEELISEVFLARPDYQLIECFRRERKIDCPGHSTVIECQLHRRWARRIKQIERDPEAFLKTYFPSSLKENASDPNFLERALETLQRLVDFPSIASFHVLPDERDTPMRVDTPIWTFGMNRRLVDVERSGPLDVDVEPIWKILDSGYAGLRNYNVWLTEVDQEVRLRRDVVDMYESMLSKKLGLPPLIHSRGYRRVKYP